MRASFVNSAPLIISPRYDKDSYRSYFHVMKSVVWQIDLQCDQFYNRNFCSKRQDDSHLKNNPEHIPNDISRKFLKFSAQGPPCNTNALPSAAAANCCFSLRVSPAKPKVDIGIIYLRLISIRIDLDILAPV